VSRTIEDVLAVAGNRPVFEALVSILGAGKAIAFVGAGASAPMYPLWGKFIELLADHAVNEGKAEDKDAKRWKADTTSTPQQRVNVILRKLGELGESLYRNFLRVTFGPRKGPDGRRYTATHGALLHVPFRAYVTTNYDPALEFSCAELRRESLSTGTPTWEDDKEVYRWRTGDVFDDDCPMLWIHARPARGEGRAAPRCRGHPRAAREPRSGLPRPYALLPRARRRSFGAPGPPGTPLGALSPYRARSCPPPPLASAASNARV